MAFWKNTEKEWSEYKKKFSLIALIILIGGIINFSGPVINLVRSTIFHDVSSKTPIMVQAENSNVAIGNNAPVSQTIVLNTPAKLMASTSFSSYQKGKSLVTVEITADNENLPNILCVIAKTDVPVELAGRLPIRNVGFSADQVSVIDNNYVCLQHPSMFVTANFILDGSPRFFNIILSTTTPK